MTHPEFCYRLTLRGLCFALLLAAGLLVDRFIRPSTESHVFADELKIGIYELEFSYRLHHD